MPHVLKCDFDAIKHFLTSLEENPGENIETGIAIMTQLPE